MQQIKHLEIVGEAETGEEAIHAATRHQPDIILLDMLLPDTSVEKLVPEIRRVSPQSKLLILTGVEDADTVYKAVDAGIDGYVLKNTGTKELVRAIEEVAEGNSYLHPTITRLVLFRAAKSESASKHLVDKSDVESLPLLTERQAQVLKLMASTATNRDIAERLVISEETVRSHVKQILAKLGASTRTQAVLAAVRLGIITV